MALGLIKTPKVAMRIDVLRGFGNSPDFIKQSSLSDNTHIAQFQ